MAIEDGRVVVAGEPGRPPEALPFKVESTDLLEQRDLRGARHVMAVEGGYLVGFNAGEFGGGLWWFSPDGKKRQRLTFQPAARPQDYVAENVRGFARFDSDFLAFQGWDHGESTGRVVQLRRGSNGQWQVSLFAELPFCPYAGVAESESTWLLASATGVWRIDAAARVSLVWKPAGAHLPSANSIVREAAGTTYVGLSGMVLRLTPRTAGDYAVEVLAPPGRRMPRPVVQPSP